MRRANKIAVGSVLGVGAVFLCGGFAMMYGQFGRFASQRDAEYAAARAEGLPLEPADLARSVAAEKNAAPVYLAAIKRLEDPSLKDERKLISDADLRGATIGALEGAEAGLATFAPTLSEIERAAERPECAFDRNWKLGPNLLLPEYTHMKAFSKMFAARAELASLKGDWRSALRDVRTGYRLARHTGQDPILIGMLVEVAQESIAHHAFMRVMSDHGDNPEFLREAARVQSEVGALPNFRHAMGGEVIFGRTAIPMIDGHQAFTSSSTSPSEPMFFERAFFQSKPVQGAFETKLLQFWRETYRDLPKDPADWEGTVKVMQRQEIRIAADESPANWANQYLMPVFTQAATAVGKVIAQRNMEATAVRLLTYRAENGAFPKALPKEWGEQALDPFSGKALMYKPEKNGFRLWSFGEDRKDNGGQTSSMTGGNAYDFVVTYPLAPRPKTAPKSTVPTMGGPGMPMDF
jgi:hypothetical protein